MCWCMFFFVRLLAAVGFAVHLTDIIDVGILVRIAIVIVAKLADDYTAFLSPFRLAKLYPSADIVQNLPVRVGWMTSDRVDDP
jgi:hypothetical protein